MSREPITVRTVGVDTVEFASPAVSDRLQRARSAVHARQVRQCLAGAVAARRQRDAVAGERRLSAAGDTVNRPQWQSAICSRSFPSNLRVLWSTLLLIAPLMNADGELTVFRDKIAAETGLLLRTVDRHLARAVAEKWLGHHVHGGHGRAGMYRATSPSCAPLSTRNEPRVARHLVANLIKESEP
jgi:hypothetical protein